MRSACTKFKRTKISLSGFASPIRKFAPTKISRYTVWHSVPSLENWDISAITSYERTITSYCSPITSYLSATTRYMVGLHMYMYMYVHSYIVHCMCIVRTDIYSVTDTCVQTVVPSWVWQVGLTLFAFRIYKGLLNDCMYRAMLVAYPTDILGWGHSACQWQCVCYTTHLSLDGRWEIIFCLL